MRFSNVCTFCNHKGDTVSPLFWSCHVTQVFWTDLAVLLKDKCVHYGSLTFSEIFILFGVNEKVETDGVLDLSCWPTFTSYIKADYKSPHLL